MNSFNRENFWTAVKLAVFVLMTWVIVSRIFFSSDFKEQYNFFVQHMQQQTMLPLVFAVFLMPLNWILETLKWKLLIQAKSSLLNLLKSVLAGVTLGFVTPARSGEFIGRVMYLDDDDKAKVFYLSTIGGIAQTAATLIAGTLFLMQWTADTFLWGLCLGGAVSFLFFYFRFDMFNRLLFSIPFLQKNSLVIENEELPSVKVSIQVLFVSLLRYGVYLFQYVLLLSFFGVGQNYFTLTVYGGVWLVVQTFSPLMPLLDISYRGGTALYVFGAVSENNLAILSAVTTVWFLNLALPAVVGYLFILQKKT